MAEWWKQLYGESEGKEEKGLFPASVDFTADLHSMGQLIYFFEYACGLSGYLLGVNPFDQPGVEAYKKNMFALLGKPGYEEMGEELRKRLR